MSRRRPWARRHHRHLREFPLEALRYRYCVPLVTGEPAQQLADTRDIGQEVGTELHRGDAHGPETLSRGRVAP